MGGWSGMAVCGGRELPEGGRVCAHIADSFCCTVEINTAL